MTEASTPARAWPEGAWLEAGDGHRVWWCEGGDPRGRPVLILHGGPGGASRIETTRWFDGLPVRWVVFDQRGCGRSTPLGATAANDLPALVADVERLREGLGIERWGLVGGSWGARVALACVAARRERVAGLFLRSPFLGSAAEAARYVAAWSVWLGEAGRQWLGAARADALRDLFHLGTVAAPAIGEDDALAQAWSAYDDAQSAPGGVEASGARWAIERLPAITDALRASWRVHAHYAATAWRGVLGPQAAARDDIAPAWAPEDGPVAIVWGEADATCDPHAARSLAQQWPSAAARSVAGAGHRMNDPRLAPVLAETARTWAGLLAQAD